jgi:hypothetical protein
LTKICYKVELEGYYTRIGLRAAFLFIQVWGGSRFFKLDLGEGQVGKEKRMEKKNVWKRKTYV